MIEKKDLQKPPRTARHSNNYPLTKSENRPENWRENSEVFLFLNFKNWNREPGNGSIQLYGSRECEQAEWRRLETGELGN